MSATNDQNERMEATSWTQYLPAIAPELVTRHVAAERVRHIELLRSQLAQAEEHLLTERTEVEKRISAMWDSSEIAEAKREAMLEMRFHSDETGSITGAELMRYLSKFGRMEAEAIQFELGSLCVGQGVSLPVTAPLQLACPRMVQRVG